MMIGLGIGIWTDVRGISQESGLAAAISPATATTVVRSTGKSMTGSSSILTMTAPSVTANTSVSAVTTTTS